MDLRQFTLTDFVLLQDTWTSANCYELLQHLHPSHAIISKRPDQYYLVEASHLSRFLKDRSSSLSLAEVVATRYAPTPTRESDSPAADAPDLCIVLEDGYPLGFFDASITPSGLTSRGEHKIEGELDLSALDLPTLMVATPASVFLDDVVSVRVSLSMEFISEASAALPLHVPPGAVVDILFQAGQGIVLEGSAEDQLALAGQEKTVQIQFQLRGVEPGLRQFKVFALYKKQFLGFLAQRIAVLSPSEASLPGYRTRAYPMKPLRLQYPGLPLLTLERTIMGKAELTPPFDAKKRQSDRSAPSVEPPLEVYPRILWQDCQPELLVCNFQNDQEGSEGDTPVSDLLVRELHALLGRLFFDTKAILVEALVPGFSGARVLKVVPFISEQGGGRPFVVKFGDTHTIEQEYENYKKYIYYFIKDGLTTSADRCEQMVYLGGILYSFVGADVHRIQDFGAMYLRRELPQVKAVLDSLFRHTCESWYANATPLEPLNLTETYHQQGTDDLKKLESQVSAHLPLVNFQQTLAFQNIPARSFPNPFRVLQNVGAFVRSTYVSTTHGDFNQHNILIDQTDHSWLIDFQNTGRSHILRDVATLDAVTRFQLLFTHQATLTEFLDMEETLCTVRHFSQLEDLQNRFSSGNVALVKTYQTVLYLRTLARWMVEKNPADDMTEYYIALLYIALNTLHYYSLEDGQRERALLSASLLLTRLGLVEG